MTLYANWERHTTQHDKTFVENHPTFPWMCLEITYFIPSKMNLHSIHFHEPSSPISTSRFGRKWSIKSEKVWGFFSLLKSQHFSFLCEKANNTNMKFCKKKKKNPNVFDFTKFSICWPALPASKGPCLFPPPTLLRVRCCWLKALRARVSKKGDSQWPQNESSESGHCCVSQLARSPLICSGKSSVADLFLTESFISVYLLLPAPLSSPPAPAWWPQYSAIMLPTSFLISGGPGCWSTCFHLFLLSSAHSSGRGRYAATVSSKQQCLQAWVWVQTSPERKCWPSWCERWEICWRKLLENPFHIASHAGC